MKIINQKLNAKEIIETLGEKAVCALFSNLYTFEECSAILSRLFNETDTCLQGGKKKIDVAKVYGKRRRDHYERPTDFKSLFVILQYIIKNYQGEVGQNIYQIILDNRLDQEKKRVRSLPMSNFSKQKQEVLNNL